MAVNWGKIGVFFGFAALSLAIQADQKADQVQNGAYIAKIAGCVTCHTDSENNGQPLSGDRELKSRFGTFYSPNITPDPETGIGNWSNEDFLRALQHGISPKNEHYYPAFPYTSFTRMNREDMLSIKAYLDSLPPVKKGQRQHILSWPARNRDLLGFWKRNSFQPGTMRENPMMSPEWNRGAYLVEAVLHCGECHTPRYSAGDPMRHRHLAGTYHGAKNEHVPNISSHRRDGIGSWTKSQVIAFLASGMTPKMQPITGSMAEVVRDSTSKLTAEDMVAIAEYLATVPAIPSFERLQHPRGLWWQEPSN
ncbi:cytochrome c [Solemya velesiana gill symbiont]|uniref:Cytochrome c domain-containing protein n=1 Tax=Solemya velesiana gill symbiont TaxID=1918948 RepID=A0A1T2KYD9_9GAMM|nr:cytochrome c [Solemya velesiana gill symbiont]OOZ37770.1 hypothetical protein BOW51_00445 [Solemya velesiana gill symbiont]